MAEKQLWDDAAFVKRAEAAAKRKGMNLQEVALAADVSRFYFDRKAEGRMTDTILIMAQVLDVSPVYLMLGVGDEPIERGLGEHE